jgi:hypothetical protein
MGNELKPLPLSFRPFLPFWILYSPVFFHTDKDLGQITAIKESFPQAIVTLCYFHVLQAVRRSISGDKYSQLCWENDGKCRPESNTFPFLEDGFPLEDALHSYKPLSKSTREGLVNLVRLHYYRHPLIPNDATHAFLSKEAIYFQCIREVCSYCKSNALPNVWIYLWSNWYTKDQFKFWGLSRNPLVPLSRTTMYVETPWRAFKRDYLYRYNRPVSVLSSLVPILSNYSISLTFGFV